MIEASLVWNQENPDLPLYIKLSETAPFFSNTMPPVEAAIVTVTSDAGEEYIFEETQPGVYTHEGFTPTPDEYYHLQIEYKEELYTASESLQPVPELEYVEQTDNGGFSGDEVELKVYYTDPAAEDNYYLFRLYHEMISLQIYDDEFTNGNRTFAFFSDEDLKKGDEVLFEIQGISRRFYEYMYILRSQAGSNAGPFQTQPTVARGNIINQSNPENFAFGYFRLSMSDYLPYQVK